MAITYQSYATRYKWIYEHTLLLHFHVAHVGGHEYQQQILIAAVAENKALFLHVCFVEDTSKWAATSISRCIVDNISMLREAHCHDLRT